MNCIPKQQILPIQLRDDATFANFYPGKNLPQITCLKEMAQGKGELYIYLWGHQGVGCSHLLQATSQSAYENGLKAFYLPLAKLESLSAALLENLESFDLICLDDVQKIAGNKALEEAVFHLYNRSLRWQTRLLMAAPVVPTALPIQLPDLSSRLMSGVILQIHALEESEQIQALQMRAQRRGIKLSAKVVQFLQHHLPRDLTTLFATLEKLDKASLSAQRNITVPFVKKTLGL